MWKNISRGAHSLTKSNSRKKRNHSVHTRRRGNKAAKKRNLWWGTRKNVKELDVSDRLLRRILKENLGLKPYKIQQQLLLSSVSKQNRENENKMLGYSMLQTKSLVEWEFFFFFLWSCNHLPKCYFTRRYSKKYQKWKKSASTMVWAVVAYNYLKSPMEFIEGGVKAHSRVYQ